MIRPPDSSASLDARGSALRNLVLREHGCALNLKSAVGSGRLVPPCGIGRLPPAPPALFTPRVLLEVPRAPIGSKSCAILSRPTADFRLKTWGFPLCFESRFIHACYGSRRPKHSLAERKKGRTPDALKDEALACVRRWQAAPGEDERAATEAAYACPSARARGLGAEVAA